MQKKLLSLMMLGMILISVATMAPVPAGAASILPKQIDDLLNSVKPGDSANYVTSRVKFALYLLLAGVVLVAVVYAILAAYKYIQSQGDPGKIGEAQKAIKAIFFGVGAMAVGVVGIILVSVFFDFDIITDPNIQQVCLSFPGEYACEYCSANPDNSNCIACETALKGTDAGVALPGECDETKFP